MSEPESADAATDESAAGALLAAGSNLGGLERADEAIAIYNELIERFGKASDNGVREVVAQGMLNKGLLLGELDRHEDANEVYADVLERYGDSTEPKIRRIAAWALYNKGYELGELKQIDDELTAYHEVLARFGDQADVDASEQIARALGSKARVFKQLGRNADALAAHDELIVRFEQSTEPDLRVHVSWALSNKCLLLQDDSKDAGELASAYDQLIARGDEAFDHALRDYVAWAMQERAAQLGEPSGTEEELVLLDEVVARFGDAPEPELRDRVAASLVTKGYALRRLGRDDEALAAFDEVVTRFRTAAEPELRFRVVDALRRKAIAQDTLGQGQAAISSYDGALAMLAEDSDTAAVSPQLIELLLEKGATLRRLDRDVEAVVVFESVVVTYKELKADRDVVSAPELLESAVLAVLYKVIALCVLHRSEETAGAREQLIELLADHAGEGSGSGRRPQAARGSETSLASFFAEIHDGDCWASFATTVDDERSRKQMVERAVDLYGRTAPWLGADIEAWETPAAVAVALRHVADGYAMLSRQWSADARAKLPMPTRELSEWAIRRFDLDEWAEERGHPLVMLEPTDAVDELIEQQRAATEDSTWAFAFAPLFAAACRNHELLAVLSDSPNGRDVLRRDGLTAFAAWQISDSRSAAAWTWHHFEDAAQIAAAMIFMAQAFFVAANTDIVSSADLFPTRELLSDLINGSDAYEWLTDQDVELPNWLSEDEE